jgi:hypothetical protein
VDRAGLATPTKGHTANRQKLVQEQVLQPQKLHTQTVWAPSHTAAQQDTMLSAALQSHQHDQHACCLYPLRTAPHTKPHRSILQQIQHKNPAHAQDSAGWCLSLAPCSTAHLSHKLHKSSSKPSCSPDTSHHLDMHSVCCLSAANCGCLYLEQGTATYKQRATQPPTD